MITPDIRIVHLVDLLIYRKVIGSSAEFSASLNMHRQSFTQIRSGTRRFTAQQVEMTCRLYNVNANWVFGLQQKNVFNEPGSIEIGDDEIMETVTKSTEKATGRAT